MIDMKSEFREDRKQQLFLLQCIGAPKIEKHQERASERWNIATASKKHHCYLRRERLFFEINP